MQHQIVPPATIHSIGLWFASKSNDGVYNRNYSNNDELHQTASMWTLRQIARQEFVYAYINFNL